MAKLLFVHGTGVREPAYSESFREVVAGARRAQLGVEPERCYWGGAQGVRLLAGGASIPNYDGVVDHVRGWELHDDFALWSLLYDDPQYELRLLAERPKPKLALAPGQRTPSEVLAGALAALEPSAELGALLDARALRPHFDQALHETRASQAWKRALATAAPDGQEHREVVARAIVARTMWLAEEAGLPVLDGGTREEIVEALEKQLGADTKGILGAVGRGLAGLAKRYATRKVDRERDLMSAAAPVAGDVLYYQSKGAEIRAFVRERVEALNDDVVLVAHSLGGIACFELLVEEALPAVTKLVTVGSQAPLLYEIDALVSLAYGSELPGHFPAWLNVYDRYDFLSFCAEGLFAGRVTDVEVSNGQPFPQSHSAYWTNAAVWRAVGAFLA